MPQLDTQQKEYEQGFYRLEDIPKHLRKYFTDKPAYTFNFEGMANELFRVLKEGGVIVWVVGDAKIDGSESGTSFRQALFFKDLGLNLHDTMIYQKQEAFLSFPNSYNQCFEYMFILSKGIPKTINLIKDRQNLYFNERHHGTRRMKDGSRKPRVMTLIKEFNSRINIWKYGTGKNKSTKDDFAFEHPAMFPEQLAADHIKSWTNEGDLILDPMCGSGTTLKMAKLLDRNFIGIDISKEYCELSEQRIKAIQNNLFEK